MFALCLEQTMTSQISPMSFIMVQLLKKPYTDWAMDDTPVLTQNICLLSTWQYCRGFKWLSLNVIEA